MLFPQQKIPDVLVQYPVLAAIDPVQRDNILRIIIVDRFEHAELTLHRLVATNHIEKTRLDSYFLSLYRKERPTPRSGVSNTSCLPENPVQGGGHCKNATRALRLCDQYLSDRTPDKIA